MKCMEPHIATCMTENEHRSLALQHWQSQPLQQEQEARGPPLTTSRGHSHQFHSFLRTLLQLIQAPVSLSSEKSSKDLIAAAGAPIKISGAGIPGFLWLQELVVVLSCEPVELRRGVGSTAEAACGAPGTQKPNPTLCPTAQEKFEKVPPKTVLLAGCGLPAAV